MKKVKNVRFVLGALFALGMTTSVIACNGGGGGGGSVETEFDFTVSLASGRRDKLYVGETDRIVSHALEARSYNYQVLTSGGEEYLTVDDNGVLTPKKPTEAGKTIAVRITEPRSEVEKNLFLTITDPQAAQTGGLNYASDDDARLEILGKLEEYAMENYLTGISLFENGGYVRYADATVSSQERKDNRVVHLPTKNYITGYGFGLLREGYITGTLENGSAKHPTYMHTATTSDPANINAWNATGSQVSDLNSYVSASYWSTKMSSTAGKYEWYPLLAKDTVDGKPFNTPIAQEPENELKMYRKWRVYVKTGAEEGIAYRINSSKRSEFNNRPVALEDYAFTYQMLLSEPCGLTRGTELAEDTSYGIKGGSTFFRNSKNKTGAQLDTLWNNMVASDELGIHTGTDENGSYIDIELINPIDDFTAMYTLSSSLYTPIPKAFIQSLGGGDYTVGAELFGSFTDTENIVDTTIAIGPYFLEEWTDGQEIVFKRNDNWYEVNETTYRIEGIDQKIYPSGTEQPDFLYNYFINGELDSTGIPSNRMSEKLTSDLKTKGDSTFKLNVNSCTQEQWDNFNDKLWKNTGIDDKWGGVKPWMSNKNFLNGLFWSINRQAFADKRGVAPSVNYLSDAYLSDPKSGTSYNTTTQHQNSIKNFHDSKNEDYGYNFTKAVTYFQMAVHELSETGALKLGTKENPTTINIHIRWMYQSDIKEYGTDIKGFFEKAFNDDTVCGGRVKLEVKQDAVTNWMDVYNLYLMTGEYDLGFGAISGNTYNPLNFLEVLKSNNSSGFTLNWGNDTSKIDKTFPIEYAGKSWSFDALWAAADHGTVVNAGKDVDPVEHCYISGTPKDLDNKSTNALYDGCKITIPFNFVALDDGTEFNISDVKLYLGGGGSFTLNEDEYTIKKTDGKITEIQIVLSAARAAAANDLLVAGNKIEDDIDGLDPVTDAVKIFNIMHPFVFNNYANYMEKGAWEIEIHYTIKIGGVVGSPVTKYVYKSKKAEDAAKKDLGLDVEAARL